MQGFRGWEVEFLLKLMCFNHDLIRDVWGHHAKFARASQHHLP